MKGILKIYHPDETIKYHIKSSYCKAVYRNQEHFLEVEIITDDNMDHVEDDSLQYSFPQIRLNVFDFPIESGNLEGNTFLIDDYDDYEYTEVDLFDDEIAYISENELSFSLNDEGVLQLIWKGMIDDFYTNSESQIPFKLKCNFKEEEFEVDED